MGQLEKYGLYVLCLVIFLILGVTIWGDGGVTPQRRTAAPSGLNAGAATPNRGTELAAHPGNGGSVGAPNLAALLQPTPRTTPPPREVRSSESGGTDTVGTLNAGGGAAKPIANSGPVASDKPALVVEPPVEPTRTYKVKAGDSFESIAKAVLGSASLRTEIARLNPDVRPERLQIGHVLVLPGAGASGAAPSPTPPKAAEASGTRDTAVAIVTYTVGKGDTFEGIARRQLGDRRRVADLRELNPDVNPTRLRVGQKIRLPKK